MKTFVVSAVSIVLASILFCPMVMAAPSSMPSDLQIVQPDPSLPKELSAFFGKWAGASTVEFFLIVEKIDEEKASIYVWRSITESRGPSWTRYGAKVIKERGKCKLWFQSIFSSVELTLKGEALNYTGSDPFFEPSTRLRRVP